MVPVEMAETFYNAYGWTELADKEGFFDSVPFFRQIYKIITGRDECDY